MAEEATPHMYAEIDHEKLMSYIPGMIDACPNRHTLDLEKAKEAVNTFVAEQEKAIENFQLVALIHAAKENPSPENIRPFLSDKGGSDFFLVAHNLRSFLGIASDTCSDASSKEAWDELMKYSFERMGAVNKCGLDLMNMFSELTDSQIEALQGAELSESEQDNLRLYLSDARKVVGDEDTLKTKYSEALAKAKNALLQLKGEDFQASENSLVNFLQASAEADIADTHMSGYPSLSVISKSLIGMTTQEIANIQKIIESENKEHPRDSFYDAPLLRNQMLQMNYSFDEAKDIACATMSRIHPSLGERAQKIFAENRAHIVEGLAMDAKAYPGLYDEHTKKYGSPYLFSSFDGNMFGVIAITHEMAHAVHFDLSAEHNKASEFYSNNMVAEQFTHLAELALKDEMLSRTNVDNERATIEHVFLSDSILSKLPTNHVASFLSDMCEAVENGAILTANDLNEMYNSSGNRTYGIQWQPCDTMSQDQTFVKAVTTALQDPHNYYHVYFTNRLAAHAVKEKFDEEPDKIGTQVVEAMKAGGTISYSDLMDGYFGKGEYEKGSMFSHGMELLAAESQRVNTLVEKADASLRDEPDSNVEPSNAKRIDQARIDGQGHGD